MDSGDKTQQIMKRVRRISLQARKRATAVFAGQYRASFRGQGLDFDDYREYTPGDEPRFIDWKVTARTGTPYVRKFFEEREQHLLLAVDTSASMSYASEGIEYTKLEYAALIAATLAYSAAQNGDKVGLLLYGRKPHFYLPPAQGVRQVLRIVREIITSPATGQDESTEALTTEILRTQRKKAMIFLMSDFLGEADKKALGKLAFRHELIPLRLADPCELELPAAGFIMSRDPESQQLTQIDLSSTHLREQYSQNMRAHRETWSRCFIQLGIDSIDLLNGQDFAQQLRQLFARRSRLFSH